MRSPIQAIPRRAFGVALAAIILSGGIASATSPAPASGCFSPLGCGPDVIAADFRDTNSHAVLAVYPLSDGASPLSSVLVKGPRVTWLADHPTQSSGKVAWRIQIATGPTKEGPWTVVQQTKASVIETDAIGPMERFRNRRISVTGDLDAFVKVRSKVRWLLADGRTMMKDSNAYSAYGLVESSGIPPRFGDEIEVSQKAATSTLVN